MNVDYVLLIRTTAHGAEIATISRAFSRQPSWLRYYSRHSGLVVGRYSAVLYDVAAAVSTCVWRLLRCDKPARLDM